MQTNENRLGYKKTKVGWIPDDWKCASLGDAFSQRKTRGEPELHVFSVTQDRGLVRRDQVDRRVASSLTSEECLLVEPGDFAYNMMRMWQGAVDLCTERGVVSPAYVVCRPRITAAFPPFMLRYFKSPMGLYKLWSYSYGLTNDRLRLYFNDFCHVPAPLPPLPEQEVIAGVLKCWDKAIRTYEAKIAKKQNIKRGLMQRLLSGNQRLLGFAEEWTEVRLGEICDVLDNQRKPLNEEARSSMQGDIPYYGANGILDHINDYVFDEELILIAEDGGHFEEFATRPIAQLIKGRTWVNNHAHVLRAKNGENAFVFFSLVHRNILKHLNGGTRAKLNKSELLSIRVGYTTQDEQQAIASLLSVAEAEINTLDRKLAVLKEQKRFLSNNLVTGSLRLPEFRIKNSELGIEEWER